MQQSQLLNKREALEITIKLLEEKNHKLEEANSWLQNVCSQLLKQVQVSNE